MTLPGFTATEFGSAEQFTGWNNPGYFYSHQYDMHGAADVMNAARDYIEKSDNSPVVKKIARVLLDNEGPSTDLYQHQSNERWVVDADEPLQLALKIAQVL